MSVFLFLEFNERTRLVDCTALVSLTINQTGLFMCKGVIFDEVLRMVAQVTGLSERDVMEGRTEECTDGRWLIVRALWMLGFTDSDSAGALGCTRQAVGYLRNRYKKSGKWVLESEWKAVRKWVESEFLEGK